MCVHRFYRLTSALSGNVNLRRRARARWSERSGGGGNLVFFLHPREKSRRLHRYPRRVIFPPAFSKEGSMRANSCPMWIAFALQTSKLHRRRVIRVYASFQRAAFSPHRSVGRAEEYAFWRSGCCARLYVSNCATCVRCAYASVRGNYVLTVQHYRRQDTHTDRARDSGSGDPTREPRGVAGVIARSRHAWPFVRTWARTRTTLYTRDAGLRYRARPDSRDQARPASEPESGISQTGNRAVS